MAHLMRCLGRQGISRHGLDILTKRCIQPTCLSSSQAYDEMREFWQKNKKLKRPLSPHLSIYKPQLTSMLSLAHRTTGIMMAVAVPVVAASLMLTQSDFTACMRMIHDMHLSPATIIACKYVLAFPLVYHYINGIRHLAWDWAKGFSLKDTYNSGYLVVALAFVATACLVHLL